MILTPKSRKISGLAGRIDTEPLKQNPKMRISPYHMFLLHLLGSGVLYCMSCSCDEWSMESSGASLAPDVYIE